MASLLPLINIVISSLIKIKHLNSTLFVVLVGYTNISQQLNNKNIIHTFQAVFASFSAEHFHEFFLGTTTTVSSHLTT